MERIRTVEAAAHVGQRVRLAGWVHAVRRLGGVNFVVLRDAWGVIQAVTEDEADLAPLDGLAEETVLALEGVVVRSPQAPGGRELHQVGPVFRAEPHNTSRDERWLGAWAREEHGSDFLFVTGYPMVKRPFYTHPEPGRPAYSNSFDLLFRGTELITGGQRLHRYEDYVEALAAADLSPEPFAAYLETFRHGMPPHGGFAIGLERLLMQLLGLGNLRLTTLFPRDRSRLTP